MDGIAKRWVESRVFE